MSGALTSHFCASHACLTGYNSFKKPANFKKGPCGPLLHFSLRGAYQALEGLREMKLKSFENSGFEKAGKFGLSESLANVPYLAGAVMGLRKAPGNFGFEKASKFMERGCYCEHPLSTPPRTPQSAASLVRSLAALAWIESTQHQWRYEDE